MNKILSDYEALDRNDFYKLFMSKLSEYSRGRALALRDAPLDKVARLQGELSAIDWALSRPQDLISKITKEETIG
jgi:hypothetical protein